MIDKVQKIREEIEKRYEYWKEKEFNSHTIESEIRMLECQHLLLMLDSLQEEPVSEELEETGREWLIPQLDKSYANYGEAKMMELTHFDGYAMLDAIEFGAKWQKEQFEKNCLAACDKQTEEEAEIESDFVMNIIKNEHRQPTFDDAIKYGMRLQKEQIRAKAEKVEISCASFAPLSSGNYKAGDKLLIIKEEQL